MNGIKDNEFTHFSMKVKGNKGLTNILSYAITLCECNYCFWGIPVCCNNTYLSSMSNGISFTAGVFTNPITYILMLYPILKFNFHKSRNSNWVFAAVAINVVCNSREKVHSQGDMRQVAVQYITFRKYLEIHLQNIPYEQNTLQQT